MSVWKGSNMIAATVPGPAGQNGTNGTNGQGIMIRPDFVELHNNINANGSIEMTNYGDGSWCSVGGYQSTIAGGQAAFVYGYDCKGSGSGTAVFGYGNDGGGLGLGTFIEGYGNEVTATEQGIHIEGWSNTLSDVASGGGRGVHIEGAEHTFVKVGADGGHQGGCGITANTPMLILPHKKPGTYQSTILEAIGLPNRGPDGEYARIVRADGSMAINGDMSFVATKADGTPETDSNHSDGVYTLGEIVKALHDAGITIPKHT